MAGLKGTQAVVAAALLGDVLVALSKTAAALWTGSSSMASEAVHSFEDIGNDLLLICGMRRSRLPADDEHPRGYGRELYFWSLVVALLVLALGAGMAVMQGIDHLRAPVPVQDAAVNYAVIALSLVFEGASFAVAFVQYRKIKRGLSLLQVRELRHLDAITLGLAAPTRGHDGLGWMACVGSVLVECSARCRHTALRRTASVAKACQRPGANRRAALAIGLARSAPRTRTVRFCAQEVHAVHSVHGLPGRGDQPLLEQHHLAVAVSAMRVRDVVAAV